MLPYYNRLLLLANDQADVQVSYAYSKDSSSNLYHSYGSVFFDNDVCHDVLNNSKIALQNA